MIPFQQAVFAPGINHSVLSKQHQLITGQENLFWRTRSDIVRFLGWSTRPSRFVLVILLLQLRITRRRIGTSNRAHQLEFKPWDLAVDNIVSCQLEGLSSAKTNTLSGRIKAKHVVSKASSRIIKKGRCGTQRRQAGQSGVFSRVVRCEP